ncbi:MAG: hypothetical protein JZU52_19230, partial [Lamprocystis purpurea]|nr:hypothetical protein [Lamprocystis purpurea]
MYRDALTLGAVAQHIDIYALCFDTLSSGRSSRRFKSCHPAQISRFSLAGYFRLSLSARARGG